MGLDLTFEEKYKLVVAAFAAYVQRTQNMTKEQALRVLAGELVTEEMRTHPERIFRP